jgi:hypothetical protein
MDSDRPQALLTNWMKTVRVYIISQRLAAAICDAMRLCQATADNFPGLTCQVINARP